MLSVSCLSLYLFNGLCCRGHISLEEGVSDDVIAGLKQRGLTVEGHVTGLERMKFGRGHVITRGAWWSGDSKTSANDRQVLWAGSDSRADGTPLPLYLA